MEKTLIPGNPALMIDENIFGICEAELTCLCCVLGYAQGLHMKQKRKYTGDPYFTHLVNVAKNLAVYVKEPRAIYAALLHDSVEDQGISPLELQQCFGPTVAQLVLEVTDVSKPSDGNREKRKQLDLEHLAQSSYLGASIKLADIQDNTSSIVEYDKDFARVYIPEKIKVLEVLKHGNEELWHTVNKQVLQAAVELEI